jgi:uncharacterized membrane protein YuzA (DUF378 family)
MEATMDIGERIRDMGRSASLLGAWAAIASFAALAGNIGGALDGEAHAISRVVIGIIGLAAAYIFWSGRNYGRDGLRAIMVWGVLQIPVFAQAVDANFTKQLIDFPLGMESSTTINGAVTDYSQIGVNLIGIAIVIWARSCQDRLDLWRRRSEPALV